MSKIKLKVVNSKSIKEPSLKRNSKLKKIILALTIVASIAVYLFYQNYITLETSYYQKATELLNNREYSEAIVNYKLAINQNPYYTESYIKLADLLALKGEQSEAIEILDKGISIAQDNQILILKKSQILSQFGNFSEAVEILTNLQKSNNSSDIQYQLIFNALLAEQKDLADNTVKELACDSEIHCLTKAFDNYKDEENIKYYIEKCIQQYPQSELCRSIKETVDNLPNSEEEKITEFVNVAKDLIEQDIDVPAILIIDDVQFFNPYYEMPYIYKAYLYDQYNNPDKAVELLNTAMVYVPDNSAIYSLLATIYFKKGEFDLAKDNILKALSFTDVTNDTYFVASQIFWKLGQFDEALENVNKLFETDELNFNYIVQKALILIYSENFNQCSDFLSEELISNFQDAEEQAVMTTLKAWCLWQIGNKNEAGKSFKSVKNVNNEIVTFFYTKYLIEQNEYEKAQEYLDKTIDLDILGRFEEEEKELSEQIMQ